MPGAVNRKDRFDGGPLMPRRWRRPVLLLTLAVYFTGLGFVGGLIVDRVRFDTVRNRVVADYTEAVQRVHEHLMLLERSAQEDTRS
jgi:hypothetical protein